VRSHISRPKNRLEIWGTRGSWWNDRAKEKPAGFERRRACVFLVDLSVADSEGNLAIFFDLYVDDFKSSYKLFFEKGLDKFSTGACGGEQKRVLPLRCTQGQNDKFVGGMDVPEQRIPFGNDRKKGKGKCRSFDCALRAPLRMTKQRQKRVLRRCAPQNDKFVGERTSPTADSLTDKFCGGVDLPTRGKAIEGERVDGSVADRGTVTVGRTSL
jgi:hypothetical protein